MTESDDLQKAKQLIKQKKISMIKANDEILKNHFQVIGSNTEKYLVVLPDFCTCMDFNIRCVKEKGMVCKHLFACSIAGENTQIVEFDDWQSLLFVDF